MLVFLSPIPPQVWVIGVLLFVLVAPLANHSAVMYFGRVNRPRHVHRSAYRRSRSHGRAAL